MTEKKLDELLSGPSGGLANLVRRAQEMQTFTERVRRVLPEEAQAHLVAATHPEGAGRTQLVLIADSSIWASRIRFCAQDILAAARDEGVAADSCRVLVQPDAAVRGDG